MLIKQRFIFFGFILIGSILLAGCLNTAVTSVQLAYNHSSIQKTVNDQYILMQAYDKLYKDTLHFKKSNISISALNQVVLLTGQVESAKLRREAVELISTIPDIIQIYNFVRVAPISTPTDDMIDAWITTKVKSKIIANNELDPSQIKVVTENSTVYLMGTALTEQADLATYFARSTDGVKKVVKIFTYLRVCR